MRPTTDAVLARALAEADATRDDAGTARRWGLSVAALVDARRREAGDERFARDVARARAGELARMRAAMAASVSVAAAELARRVRAEPESVQTIELLGYVRGAASVLVEAQALLDDPDREALEILTSPPRPLPGGEP